MSILLVRWPAACRAQHWDKNDRALRLRVISQAIGRWVKTMNELNSTKDIDAVYAHLGMLANSVAATVETLPSDEVVLEAGKGEVSKSATAGERRRILWLIREHAKPLGGEPYILALAKSKFHVVAGLNTIDDLPTNHLHQLMMTLNVRRRSKAKSAPVESHPEPEPEFVAGPF